MHAIDEEGEIFHSLHCMEDNLLVNGAAILASPSFTTFGIPSSISFSMRFSCSCYDTKSTKISYKITPSKNQRTRWPELTDFS